MRKIRKSEHYSLDKVEQRIAYYENQRELITDVFKSEINLKLLTFWINYKLKNYTDGQTKS